MPHLPKVQSQQCTSKPPTGGFLSMNSMNASGGQSASNMCSTGVGSLDFLHRYATFPNCCPPLAAQQQQPQMNYGAMGMNKAPAPKQKSGGNKDNCCAPLTMPMPPGYEECPPMNMTDICEACCGTQKTVCSLDPNCHQLPECKRESLGSTCKYLRNRGPRLPSWLAHCGRVLMFYGYFQEPIPETWRENYRIRHVQIRYYMDDGTIDVFEPKTMDSAMPQGRLIRRHRIPLPAPADSDFYTMDHLNVGCEIEFYGKVFLICGCNEPTRRYLNKLGITVPPNLIMPTDPYTQWRKEEVSNLYTRNVRLDRTQVQYLLGKQEGFLY